MDYQKLESTMRVEPSTLSADLEIFALHFPGNPLLPGALSAFLLSEKGGDLQWSLKKINGLRFRKPVLPNIPLTVSCPVTSESSTEKVCAGKISSGVDTLADGEFTFEKRAFPQVKGAKPEPDSFIWGAGQIREYLPHGESIVLIDKLVSADYPQIIRDQISGKVAKPLDQADLVGTRVHTRSKLNFDNFWLNKNCFPSPVLSELVAQAGALTLAPFFKGTKPQVSLLGCDTEYFAIAQEGSIIDTFVELTRVKRLGKTANMILFKSECFVGDTKIAHVNLNAMASFSE